MRLAALLTMAAMGVMARAGEPAAGSTPSPTATLVITVTGARSDRGTIVIAVFTQRDGWPRLGRAQRAVTVPATAPARVIVEGLAPGECAVSAFHDEDGDGKLGMRWFPLPHPAERTGASSGATGRLGPPSFEAARLACPAGETLVPIALAD